MLSVKSTLIKIVQIASRRTTVHVSPRGTHWRGPRINSSSWCRNRNLVYGLWCKWPYVTPQGLVRGVWMFWKSQCLCRKRSLHQSLRKRKYQLSGFCWLELESQLPVKCIFVPKLKYNLFSAGADKGLEMQSNRTICKFSKHERTVAVGVRKKKLYAMRFEVIIRRNKPNEVNHQHNQPEALAATVD